MKLRQKLAVVLATAMVATAVPVVTFATATTQIKREVMTVKKDHVFMTTSAANAVKVTFDNEAIDADAIEVVYLTLENAEWSDEALSNCFTKVEGKDVWTTTLVGSDKAEVATTFTKQSGTVMKVTMELKGKGNDNTFYIPLLAQAKGGEAKVLIENKGNGMLSKKNSWVFATTGEKKFNVKLDDAKTFYNKGELPKITLDEAYPGSLEKGGEFKIELNNTEFEFDDQTIAAKAMYGFNGTVDVKVTVDEDDTSAATVKVAPITGDGSLGTIEITGIQIRSKERNPEAGEVTGDIKSVEDSMSSDMNDVKFANISEYATYIKMKDDKAKEIKAGRIDEIEYEIGESVDDSFITNRDFELTIDNGNWDYKGLVETTKTKLDGKDKYEEYSDDDYKKAALKINPAELASAILDNDNDWKGCEAEFAEDGDKANTQTIYFTIGTDKNEKSVQSNNSNDVLKFKQKVCVPIDKKEAGTITLKVDGRAVEDQMSTTAVTIIDPFKVTFEPVELKVGLQGQVGGVLTLTENDKDMFQKGKIEFKIKDKDERYLGIYLTDLKTEASEGIRGEKTGDNKKDKSAYIQLTRATKEAGSITFKDLKFTVDRTVPEGTYDLEISGSGIDADGHTLSIPNFIKITTANIEDMQNANGLAAVTADFTIDSTSYVVNGIQSVMDAPAYIAGEGYTMIPMRYIAKAFGVSEKNILFSNGTATFFAGSRTIQLTTNSDVAIVNGASVKMSTKVVNKEGRLYVPVGEVANILGINKSWDPATKTATFSNINTAE